MQVVVVLVVVCDAADEPLLLALVTSQTTDSFLASC